MGLRPKYNILGFGRGWVWIACPCGLLNSFNLLVTLTDCVRVCACVRACVRACVTPQTSHHGHS